MGIRLGEALGFGRRLHAAAGALSAVFRNPNLRRLQLASAGNVTAEWAYTVALGVYAYEYGGTAWVGLVGLIRMIPATASAALGSIFTDRFPRHQVLFVVFLLRSLILVASAVAVVVDAPIAVFVLAGLVSVIAAATRPAEWALRPLLAGSPEELAATNVAASVVEGASVFVGPGLAALILSRAEAGIVFLLASHICVTSAHLVARIKAPQVAYGRDDRASGVIQEAVAGARALATRPDPRLIVSLFGAQTLVRGMLNVLIVVAAIEVLAMGEPGVGWLNAAFGVGNLIGGFAALALVGRRALASPFGLGLALWGIPIALLALWPHPAAAVVLLAVPGFGNAIQDVAGLTMLQRITPDDVLGRVFGALEAIVFITVAAGSIIAPLIIIGLGPRWALAATGLLLPALVTIFAARLREIDARAVPPETEIALLRRVQLFASLPAIAIERLAMNLEPVDARPGDLVIEEGTPGDRFYVIGSGVVEIRHGDLRVVLRDGDYFGEIALLETVSRTASVEAVVDSRLYALGRGDFISALRGDAQSAEKAHQVAKARLQELTGA